MKDKQKIILEKSDNLFKNGLHQKAYDFLESLNKIDKKRYKHTLDILKAEYQMEELNMDSAECLLKQNINSPACKYKVYNNLFIIENNRGNTDKANEYLENLLSHSINREEIKLIKVFLCIRKQLYEEAYALLTSIKVETFFTNNIKYDITTNTNLKNYKYAMYLLNDIFNKKNNIDSRFDLVANYKYNCNSEQNFELLKNILYTNSTISWEIINVILTKFHLRKFMIIF